MDRIIHLTATLKCDPHHAYEMFTVNAKLTSWLTRIAEVEPVVGEKFELFWRPEDRENDSTIGCKVTAVEVDQMISFEWRSPVQFKHFANDVDPLTHVVVFFIPDGEVTKVHLIHSGWRKTPEWEEARQWQEKAWRMALKVLEKQFDS
jgi:uncharacterized protein YndB with AHSA1/START domain